MQVNKNKKDGVFTLRLFVDYASINRQNQNKTILFLLIGAYLQ